MPTKARKFRKTGSTRPAPKNHSHRLTEVYGDGFDWKTRTVWIAGDLTEERGFKYVPGIRMMDETPGPIKVVIMSGGGFEAAGFAIFDALRACRCHVTTIGMGEVFSIAALIFQAGDERVLFPHTELMMHNGTTLIEGGDVNTDLIERIAAEANKNNARYHTAIATRSGIDLPRVVQWCKDEKYFLADEAVKEGLADRLVHIWGDI